jgi:hypothetical protein
VTTGAAGLSPPPPPPPPQALIDSAVAVTATKKILLEISGRIRYVRSAARRSLTIDKAPTLPQAANPRNERCGNTVSGDRRPGS